MSSQATHPTDEMLEEYHFQRLGNGALEQVEEHLLWCVDCQDRLSHAERLISQIKTTLQSHPPAKATWRTLWQTIPTPVLAGAGVVALTVGLYAPRLGGSNQSLAEVTLVTSRGAESPTEVRVHQASQTKLNLDVTGLSLPVVYRVEVVSQEGAKVFAEAVSVPQVTLHATLNTGVYFVRLNTPAGDPLREYVLEVEP